MIRTAQLSVKPETLIKSRARVRDLGEVYTASREVNAMLDTIDTGDPTTSAFTDLDTTFLEPACGNGNFLAEILRRKLQLVQYRELPDVRDFEFGCLRALASLYGIDISEENVLEARARLLAIVDDHYSNQVVTLFADERFRDAAREVLRTNILRGDTLNGTAHIEVVEYRIWSRHRFRRLVHPFDEVAEPVPAAASTVRRLPACSYLRLAEHPATTGLRLVEAAA